MRPWMDQLMGLGKMSDQAEDRPRLQFDEAAAAHHYIQDRKNIGKVLLAPSSRSFTMSVVLACSRRAERSPARPASNAWRPRGDLMLSRRRSIEAAVLVRAASRVASEP